LKKPSVLKGHVRIGKRFVPPMARFNWSDARWIDLILPDLLWLALLTKCLGFGRASQVALATTRAARATLPDEAGPNFTFLSDFEDLDNQQKLEILAALNRRDLLDLQRAVGPVAASYPTFPLSFIFDGREGPPSPDLPRLKDLLRELFDRGGTSATLAQGHAIGLAMMIGRLKVMETSMLAKIDQIGDYPHTEISEAVGSAVRASVSVLHSGGPNPPTRRWPVSFWARGLELESCEVS
jgi:hypothetical protein